MYKAQFKNKSPYEAWTTHGSYGNENAAIAGAMARKNMGAMIVRVIDSKGSVIYSN
jgi:hypothetical protein